MNVIASTGQLRAGLLRWTLLTVPTMLLLGLLSGTLSGSGAGNVWFATLVKPAAYPPASTFGIVWPILYVLMGIALAVIFAARGAPGRGPAVVVFVVQAALNLAWSPVFFAMHDILAALVVIALLDLAVLATILLFYRVRPIAALLLVPYLLWIGFATYLNWELHVLNPVTESVEVSGAVQRIEF
ncbi:tryptophan-rich sensory protein [Novosphingobium sp. PC22D]|uniref:TspO/MBR family protein n=1 Tax=Novosphingobium sp. PC22D TaxID=1962403 RepID=UPI000BF07746|nr:TspO/MBR family protein [Novosphingobium sp. PC22D]PEQ13733.1 tryptophan-rich sensory protein [Novosphingobium sp. PC22D]